MHRICLFLLTLLLPLAAIGAPAQDPVAATLQPLPPPPASPSDQPLQRQTGMVVIEREGGQRIIVRSLEPDSLIGGDRLDFNVLDADGDGAVDRAEAGVDRELQRRFDGVDANRDGVLDREELVDWIQ